MPPTIEDIAKRNAFIAEKYGYMPTGAEFIKACSEWQAEQLGKAMESDDERNKIADYLVRANH